MRALRLFLIFTVILMAILGVVGALGLVPTDELLDTGGKLFGALCVLGLAGGAIGRITEDQKTSTKVSHSDDTKKQGPQF